MTCILKSLWPLNANFPPQSRHLSGFWYKCRLVLFVIFNSKPIRLPLLYLSFYYLLVSLLCFRVRLGEQNKFNLVLTTCHVKPAISLSASDIAGTLVRLRSTCKAFDRGRVFAKSVYCTTAITFYCVLLFIIATWC